MTSPTAVVAGMVLKPNRCSPGLRAIPAAAAPARCCCIARRASRSGQADLRRWAGDYGQLVLLCGHYEGFETSAFAPGLMRSFDRWISAHRR